MRYGSNLGFFYQPPNQYNFLHLIEDDFEKFNPESKELHILGDMNINTLIDDNRSKLGKIHL